MRLLLASLVLLAGCNRAADHLVGSWEFDAATYELIPRYRELSKDEQRHWVETAQMDLTITAGTISWEQRLPGWGSRSASGDYRVVAVDGSRVDIDIELPGKTERVVFTVQENRLRFGLAGRSIILKRKRP